MRLAIIALVLVLSGCAGYSSFKLLAAEEGARVADEALEAAIWHVCKASPVGAVMRRFNTPELRAAYTTICKDYLPK